MTNPLISILVCCHNRADMLPMTLDSILEQRYEPVEIIVLDDGSTDHTATVMAAYSKHVRYERQDNQGIALARTNACKLASGELIAFVDDDDLMPPDRLTVLFSALSQFPEAIFATGDIEIIDENGRRTGRRWLAHDPGASAQPRLIGNGHEAVLWPRAPASVHTTLFRRKDGETIGWFSDEFRFASEDKDFFARLGLMGPIVYVPEIVSLYRQGHASLTHATPNVAVEQLLLLTKHMALLTPDQRHFRRRLENRLLSILTDVRNADKDAIGIDKDETARRVSAALMELPRATRIRYFFKSLWRSRKTESRTRRVLIIVENLPVPFDRRVWQEANTLRSAGYEVSIICPKAPGFERPRERLNEIEIYRHPLPLEADSAAGYLIEYSTALFWQFVLALRISLGRGFDVIHACNPPDLIFLVALPFKLFGKRFVFDHHDLNPELYEAKFGRRGVLYRVMCLLEKLTFKLADRSIATNDSYKKIAIERGGMQPRHVAVVRSGPSLDRMRIKAPAPEWRFGKTFLVGYVGVMGRQEGIDLLLHAVEHIVRELDRQDIHFALVGGGTELESLRAECTRLGLNDFVTFTGRVDDATLLDVLNTADICVNSDIVNDMNDKSTMNKIMEYMALGKPIVQFELTEGRVSAGEASVYAKPNDTVDFAVRIVELLGNPEKRSKMARIGRERIESALSWKHQEPKLLSLYENLLS